jgi:hypothetical protein
MARLQFRGNWNPEPGAWPRMGKLLETEAGTSLRLTDMAAEGLATAGGRPALAHLAGTGTVSLSGAAQQAVRAYVQSGGTLLVEAVGGDATFARTGRECIGQLFPGAELRVVPAGYLLYTGAFSPKAVKIGEVDYRRPAVPGADRKPRLEYLVIDDRVAVLFSDQDLTHGLLGYDTAGVTGYTPASAQAIARNLVLFAAANEKR